MEDKTSTNPVPMTVDNSAISSIPELLDRQSKRIPDAVSITSPGRTPLSYSGLQKHVDDVVKMLNAWGVGRNDRVAIVLPNGPEMAVTFLGVAAAATAAPLNPGYSADEFDFYLSDLNAKALVVHSGIDSPARAAAQARGIPVIELTPVSEAAAGIFKLSSDSSSAADGNGFAELEDVALVLHTSGTTARPKIVPLTQRNLCTSAHNIRSTLDLGETDRCLNVMPLFHIHGLIGALLSSLAAGASVVCTPGFSATKFFQWVAGFHPTWYTAVPTMHQAILARAATHRKTIERCPLRFIRSSSAALPPQIMTELEEVFEAPVIESYGMTEASHQMASNPLPPGKRKAGSVGVAAGPEIAILGEGSNLLPVETKGEIVIRGAMVTRAYENNPQANERAFTNGWFRTGDEGFLGADGYLFITGRLKEIINRGGEKIAPREVDEVMMDHPAIAQAVTFAVPHPTLGEDVVAAVVLEEKASASEREIRQFAFARLAAYKIPSQVLIVDEIPKGATGKIQRIGLAEKLARELKAEFVPPRNHTEEILARIWVKVLGVEQVGVHDNFFTLGGDSLLAARVFAEIEEKFGDNLPVTSLFEAPTIGGLAGILGQKGWSAPWSCVVPIQAKGSKPPFFCVHGPSGQVLGYRNLASHLGEDQPFYGIQAQGLNEKQPPHTRIEDMAAHYVKEIRTLYPHGPYYLGGFCFGGQVAFEMARQLQEQGQKVAFLGLFDSYVRRRSESSPTTTLFHSKAFVLKMNWHLRNLVLLQRGEQLTYLLTRVRNLKTHVQMSFWNLARRIFTYIGRPLPSYLQLRDLRLICYQAGRDYLPEVYQGRVTIFLSEKAPETPSEDPRVGWTKLAVGGSELHFFTGGHETMLLEPHLRVVAKKLKLCLEKTQATELQTQTS